MYLYRIETESSFQANSTKLILPKFLLFIYVPFFFSLLEICRFDFRVVDALFALLIVSYIFLAFSKSICNNLLTLQLEIYLKLGLSTGLGDYRTESKNKTENIY